MVPLQVGSFAIIYYAKGDGSIGEIEGTITTIAPQYLEVTTASGSDICVGWSKINLVLVS